MKHLREVCIAYDIENQEYYVFDDEASAFEEVFNWEWEEHIDRGEPPTIANYEMVEEWVTGRWEFKMADQFGKRDVKDG